MRNRSGLADLVAPRGQAAFDMSTVHVEGGRYGTAEERILLKRSGVDLAEFDETCAGQAAALRWRAVVGGEDIGLAQALGCYERCRALAGETFYLGVRETPGETPYLYWLCSIGGQTYGSATPILFDATFAGPGQLLHALLLHARMSIQKVVFARRQNRKRS